jgi:group I intron endonuclease
MAHGIIYLITNKITSKKFVGKTTLPINKEWQNHILESKKMSRKLMYREFRKYGIDKFNIKQIDECDEKILEERRVHWIKHHKTHLEGYNLHEVKEEKERISVISNTKPWGELTDKNRGNGKHSGIRIQGKNIITGEIKEWENARVAAIEITGDANKNANILTSAKKGNRCYGYKWTLLEEKSKKKAVYAVNRKTEKIEHQFESIVSAQRALGGGSYGTALTRSLRNPGRYTWKGYYWYYSG